MREPAPELLGFLSAFDPAIARLFLDTRRLVLAAAPDANELIYDAYNAVSVAYTFTGRLAEAFCHVAGYTAHVNLGFNRGAALADPAGLLLGSGARIRHVRIAARRELAAPALRRLVRAAVSQGRSHAPHRPARAATQVRPTTGAKRRPKPRARR